MVGMKVPLMFRKLVKCKSVTYFVVCMQINLESHQCEKRVGHLSLLVRDWESESLRVRESESLMVASQKETSMTHIHQVRDTLSIDTSDTISRQLCTLKTFFARSISLIWQFRKTQHMGSTAPGELYLTFAEPVITLLYTWPANQFPLLCTRSHSQGY